MLDYRRAAAVSIVKDSSNVPLNIYSTKYTSTPFHTSAMFVSNNNNNNSNNNINFTSSLANVANNADRRSNTLLTASAAATTTGSAAATLPTTTTNTVNNNVSNTLQVPVSSRNTVNTDLPINKVQGGGYVIISGNGEVNFTLIA